MLLSVVIDFLSRLSCWALYFVFYLLFCAELKVYKIQNLKYQWNWMFVSKKRHNIVTLIFAWKEKGLKLEIG